MEHISDNKRIAKNTLLLYIRSLLMMLVGIYTSRVVLQALGVEDFGLYAVVGSVLIIFTFINGVLATGTSRFITFDLGKNDKEALSDTFSAAFLMHVIIGVFIVILLETIGLWYLENYVNIPPGREYAAKIVFHVSAVTCFFTIIQIPYSAEIIAHENMSLYAYVGLVEAFYKLLLPLSLLYFDWGDNLIAYGFIMAIWSIGIQIFYRVYCLKHWEETRIHFVKKRKVYTRMMTYSFWDLLGTICGSVNIHGIPLIINMFFGVSVNAAQNISSTVQGKVEQFVANFITATNPQIIKSYAQQNFDRFFFLIREAGRISYFLYLFIALPVFMECEYILNIWLVEVPMHAEVFLRFALGITLFRTIARPLINGVHATGNVKFMNLSAGLFAVITTLPGTFILFKLGFPYWSYLILLSVTSVFGSTFEIVALFRNIKFDVWKYIKHTYIVCIYITSVSCVLPAFITYYFDESFYRFCLNGFVCVLSVGLSVWFLGLSDNNRNKIIAFTKEKIKSKFYA